MSIGICRVESLGDYYDAVSRISNDIAKKKGLNEKGIKKEVLSMWFRAEASFDYALIPSLYRRRWKGVQIVRGDSEEQYSNMHYAEDIRTQHYHAKNYHYLAKEPSSRIEFLEVMQHHGVKTRVLDWSESSTHSLLFALEPFYSEKADNFYQRNTINPCIWVLDPSGLNLEIIEELGKDQILQKELMAELELTDCQQGKVLNRIKNLSSKDAIMEYMEDNGAQHIDNILNLSEIYDEIVRERYRIKSLLVEGEAFNPVYYLLARIYADGYLLNNYKLPPLAVVQPYHSERIKAQKGVFSVFPFYKDDRRSQDIELYEKFRLNPESMSYNKIAKKHLYKIILDRPQKIAYEILANGMNESWLYPEMPIASNEIEHHQIY